jgi:hypothetical protein
MTSRDMVVKSSLSMPSFSSFDPSRLSAPSAQDAALLDILDRSEDSGEESGEIQGTDKKPRKRKKHKKDKSGKKHRRKDETPKDEVKQPPPFYKDRVGDSLNLTYGTIHGSAIPIYKCLGGSFCSILGCIRELK